MKTQIAGLYLVRRHGSIGIAIEKGGEMIVWCDAPVDRTAKAGWTAILAALDNGYAAQSRPAQAVAMLVQEYRRLKPAQKA